MSELDVVNLCDGMPKGYYKIKLVLYIRPTLRVDTFMLRVECGVDLRLVVSVSAFALYLLSSLGHHCPLALSV